MRYIERVRKYFSNVCNCDDALAKYKVINSHFASLKYDQCSQIFKDLVKYNIE